LSFDCSVDEKVYFMKQEALWILVNMSACEEDQIRQMFEVNIGSEQPILFLQINNNLRRIAQGEFQDIKSYNLILQLLSNVALTSIDKNTEFVDAVR